MCEPKAEISEALKKKLKTILLTIDDEQYDVTQFASKHPGNGYGDAGTLWQYKNQDVSDLFAKYHCDGGSKADAWLAKAREDRVKGFMGIVYLGPAKKLAAEKEAAEKAALELAAAEKEAAGKAIEPEKLEAEKLDPEKATGSQTACCVQ